MQTGNTSRGRLRVLLLGRRFWPLGGFDSAAALTRLAIGLSRGGLHVEVATAKFASSWPNRFHFHDCLVHRAANAPKSDWTISRYTRHLTQWLRGKLESFDVVLVDSICEEAIAAIDAARGKSCSTILMFHGSDAEGEISYWQKSHAAKRCAAFGRMADAVIVRHALDHRHLLTHRYDEKRLHRIPIPIPVIPQMASTEHHQTTRAAARKNLALANSDLTTLPETPVILCHARLDKAAQVDNLVAQAQSLVAGNPDFRIWFLGDGPLRDQIHSQLRGDGIRSHIAMPGSFCGLDDVMNAADAFIQPGSGSMRCFLPLAVAHDRPLIACDDPVVRASLPNMHHHVNWFDPEREYDLRKQVENVFFDPDLAWQSAVAFRQEWNRQQSESDQIRQIIDVIKVVVARRLDHSFRESARLTR